MLIVGVLQFIGFELPFDASSLTFLLGLISSGATVLVNYYNKRIKEEEYSTAYALADGYFNNFLEPAVTRLLTEYGTSLQFLIYLPEQLAELSQRSIDRTMVKLQNAKYSTGIIHLDLEEGRARDVLTIMKSEQQTNRFFDFPNTLLTLANLVDYRLESERDSFNEERRNKMTGTYIGKFRQRLEQRILDAELEAYVEFTDRSLQPLINS